MACGDTRAAGKLMFVADCTRPDIMQPVAKLARYLARPREALACS
jgi:hypothetical protein